MNEVLLFAGDKLEQSMELLCRKGSSSMKWKQFDGIIKRRDLYRSNSTLRSVILRGVGGEGVWKRGSYILNSEIISHRIRCKIAFEIRIGLGFNQSFVSAFGRRLLHVFSVSFPRLVFSTLVHRSKKELLRVGFRRLHCHERGSCIREE